MLMQMSRPHHYASSKLFVQLVVCLYDSLICTVVVSTPLDFAGQKEALSPAPAQLEDRAADSDLSDRLVTLFIFL